MMLSHLFYALAASSVLSTVAGRKLTIINKCPSSIKVYVNGVAQGTLGTGVTNTSQISNDWSGFVYTDANGGAQSGVNTTRAGFYGTDAYYYIVVDPNGFNTGVQIAPTRGPQPGGFCNTDACNSLTCSNAYQGPPTRFPPSASTAPQPPLYQCPNTPNNINFNVTFCPTGAFPSGSTPPPPPPPPPPPTPHILHPNGDSSKCLDVRGAVFENGTPVQIYDCNNTPAQDWVINSGNTKVQLWNTNYCLDAGSNPGNGVGMKIWQCYDNLPAQAWYYTDDERIALAGKGQCLDLPNGAHADGVRVQTWHCTDNNTNQIWSEQLPFPTTGTYCCPPTGPTGATLTAQQTGPFTIFCYYGDAAPQGCYYDPLIGTGGGPSSGCPAQAPKNPHPPTCPI